MSASLPARPHLDHLRRQARELLRALRAQDPAAWARAAPYRIEQPPKLTAAQLVPDGSRSGTPEAPLEERL